MLVKPRENVLVILNLSDKLFKYYGFVDEFVEITNKAVDRIPFIITAIVVLKWYTYQPMRCEIATPAKKVIVWYSCHHCSHRHTQVVHLSANEVRDCLIGTPAKKAVYRIPIIIAAVVILKWYTYQPMR
jgi:hypothetical protein